jgi:two-component system OmpR family response regulator
MASETINALLALPDKGALATNELEELGIHAEHIGDLSGLRERMNSRRADIVIVDVSLLDCPWFDLLIGWRLRGDITPAIIVLSEDDELEASPDSYLGHYDFQVKPLRADELHNRARALLALRAQASANVLKEQDLHLDMVSREVLLAGEAITLTAHEFRMLRFFMVHQRRVIPQAKLCAFLYADETKPDSNTVEAYISRLRRKIGASRIRTIRGAGYRFG